MSLFPAASDIKVETVVRQAKNPLPIAEIVVDVMVSNARRVDMTCSSAIMVDPSMLATIVPMGMRNDPFSLDKKYLRLAPKGAKMAHRDTFKSIVFSVIKPASRANMIMRSTSRNVKIGHVFADF